MVRAIAMKTFIIFICVSSSWANIIDNHINLSLSYHNGFLMLQCHVRNKDCCNKSKKIEFKRNDKGVCNLKECTGAFTIPQTRVDTENYRCFCPGSNLNRAHLMVTETRSTDYGPWTCECTDGATDKVCKSNTLDVSPASLKEDIAPVPHSTPESKTPVGWIVGIVGVIIISVFAILIVVRFCLSRRVRVERRNLLTRICLGKGKQSTNTETENLNPPSTVNTTDILSQIIERQVRIENSIQQIANSTQRRNQTANSPDIPEWCTCFQCKKRERHAEQLCCKLNPCITSHDDFVDSCFKEINNNHTGNSEEQKEKRVKAYKNYNKWGHGIIAAEHRIIILPACCVDKIREKYPDPNNNYTGIEKEHIFVETPDS